MKKRNVYKGIVWLALFLTAAWHAAGKAGAYRKEQQAYEFTIESELELTEGIVEELRKISGLFRFDAALSAPVTLQLGTYRLETKLSGVNLSSYPLQWKAAQKNILRGNTPALFLGEDVLASMTDQDGRSPGRAQVKKWVNEYKQISLTVTDETGKGRKAVLCGILKQPADGVYMDRDQMREVFQTAGRATGGRLMVHGFQNMKKARRLLEDAGFVVL